MNQKSWWYDLHVLKYRVWQTQIGNYESFFAFLPPTPTPLKPPKVRNLNKMKKMVGDIIILPKCTKNHNHTRSSSWDTEWDRTFFFGHFLPFYPTNNPENQNIWENLKNHLEIIPFCTCVPQITIIWCMLPEI